MEGITGHLSESGSSLSRMRFDKADKADNASPSAGSLLGGFGEALKTQMNTINTLQTQANTAQQTYATGGEIELHNVMLAMEKADLSLQLAMQIRNKAVAAYQEISHMSV